MAFPPGRAAGTEAGRCRNVLASLMMSLLGQVPRRPFLLAPSALQPPQAGIQGRSARRYFVFRHVALGRTVRADRQGHFRRGTAPPRCRPAATPPASGPPRSTSVRPLAFPLEDHPFAFGMHAEGPLADPPRHVERRPWARRCGPAPGRWPPPANASVAKTSEAAPKKRSAGTRPSMPWCGRWKL